MDTVSRLLKTLLLYQQTGKRAQIPCLVGLTGAGKTERTHTVGADPELGLKSVATVLLGTHLPEDVGGLPRVTVHKDRKVPVTQFALIEEIQSALDEPTMIHLDEIDKAREEVHATVLTLCGDRKIRNRRLHPKSVITTSAQPMPCQAWLASQTQQAMAARMTFLKVGYEWDYVRKEISLPLKWLKDTGTDFEVPLVNANPRGMTRIVQTILHAGASLSPDERALLIKGTLPVQDADALLDELQLSAWLDLGAAFKSLPKEVVAKLDLNTLCQAAGDLMLNVSDKAAFEQAFRRVFLSKDATIEHQTLFMQHLFDKLSGLAPNVGDSVEILPGIPDEELHKLLAKLVKEYNDKQGKK